MVSIFNLFTNKKKARPTSISGSSSINPTQNDPSGKHPSNRLPSIRSRSSVRRSQLINSQSSTDVSRRKSQVGRSDGILELPKLDFDFGEPDLENGVVATNGEVEFNSGMETSNVDSGGSITLSDQEVKLIDETTLSFEEVGKGWKWFGRALKELGTATPDLFLPRNLVDSQSRYEVLSLFLLSVRPEISALFPSILARTPSPGSESGVTWFSRLHDYIGRSANYELAEVLKWTLRHLDVSASAESNGEILDHSHYVKFLQSEQGASYPMDAYQTLLSPLLRQDVGLYLNEVFEVWSAIAGDADSKGMTAGRINLLLGFWLWSSSSGNYGTWKELYEAWLTAGRRIEHIFYAWIRNQSFRQQLPPHTLQLVHGYPPGEPSASNEHRPLPAPSTISRTTLHIKLGSSQAPAGKHWSRRQLLDIAIEAESQSNVALPKWHHIVTLTQSDVSKAMADLISPESLENTSQDLVPTRHSTTPQANNPDLEAQDEPLYRPFKLRNASASQAHLRLRSQSHGDLRLVTEVPAGTSGLKTSMTEHMLSAFTVDSPPSSSHEPASNRIFWEAPSWEQFAKTGFSGPEDEIKFKLSPPAMSDTAVGDHQLPNGKEEAAKHNNLKADSFSQPGSSTGGAVLGPEYQLLGEDIIELDDAFLPFVEDAQRDTVVTANWPTLALLRLRTPIDLTSSPSVEWILIDIERSPPSSAGRPSISPLHARSVSPTASPTSRTSSFGFSDLGGSFRRLSSVSSVTGKRRSFFGFPSSRSISQQNGGLAALAEGVSSSNDQSQPRSTSVLAPAIPPLGFVRTDPTSSDDLSAALGTTSSPLRSTEALSQVSAETLVSEWSFKAEGGAHIIFVYHGTSPTYNGQILRVRKVAHNNDEANRVNDEWRSNLLPRLLPSEVLVEKQEVNLDLEWATQLLQSVEGERASERTSIHVRFSASPLAWLMPDLTAVPMSTGTGTVLAIEIKPKCGFLPSADYLHPPESVQIKTRHSRFTMVQHLRGLVGPEKVQYDPLDLYSGEESRMSRALEGLCNAWEKSEGKANDWRMFVDGKQLSPLQQDSITRALKKGMLSTQVAPFVVPALQSSGIMQVLKTLQASLDATDISDLAQRFRQEYPEGELFDPALVPEPTASELREFVDLYLSPNGRADTWTLRQRLVAYSLAAVFKDCSIMLKTPLQPGPNGTYGIEPGSTEIKIIDLDLKPMQSLRKWYDHDEEVWRHWMATHPEEKESRHSMSHAPAMVTFSALDVASTNAVFMPTRDTSTEGTPEHDGPDASTQSLLNEVPALSHTQAQDGSFSSATDPSTFNLEDPLATTLTAAAPRERKGSFRAFHRMETVTELPASERFALDSSPKHDLVPSSEAVLGELNVDQTAYDRERSSFAPSPSPHTDTTDTPSIAALTIPQLRTPSPNSSDHHEMATVGSAVQSDGTTHVSSKDLQRSNSVEVNPAADGWTDEMQALESTPFHTPLSAITELNQSTTSWDNAQESSDEPSDRPANDGHDIPPLGPAFSTARASTSGDLLIPDFEKSSEVLERVRSVESDAGTFGTGAKTPDYRPRTASTLYTNVHFSEGDLGAQDDPTITSLTTGEQSSPPANIPSATIAHHYSLGPPMTVSTDPANQR